MTRGTVRARRADAPTSACLNCGTGLDGPYCHHCGQAARSPLQPAGIVARDLVEEFLDLDNRVLRSLKALLLRPGFLTLEYVAGRRRRWTTPLRLYLLGALVYFVVAGWTEPSSFLFVTGTDQTAFFLEWLPRLLAVLVPVFAVFDRWLFRGDDRLWAESLVFGLHVHAGWFLISTVGALQGLLPDAGEPFAAWQIALSVPVGLSQLGIWAYLWLALRRFHGFGRWATSWRMVTLILMHALAMAALLIPLVGLLGSE